MEFYINRIEDLYGKECIYYSADGEDEDGYEIHLPIRVKIIGYEIEVESKPPYNIDLLIQIEPIGEHNFDEQELNDLRL